MPAGLRPQTLSTPVPMRNPLRAGGDRAEQCPGVVAPALGQQERVVAERLGPVRDVQHDVLAGFQRGDTDGERAGWCGHGPTLRLRITLVISGMRISTVGSAKPCACSRVQSSAAEKLTQSGW